jgi:hypothetical protein
MLYSVHRQRENSRELDTIEIDVPTFTEAKEIALQTYEEEGAGFGIIIESGDKRWQISEDGKEKLVDIFADITESSRFTESLRYNTSSPSSSSQYTSLRDVYTNDKAAPTNHISVSELAKIYQRMQDEVHGQAAYLDPRQLDQFFPKLPTYLSTASLLSPLYETKIKNRNP